MSNVTIFQDVNYSGPSQQLSIGDHDMNSISIGNDQLSSLQVPAGMIVTLFADAGFSGTTKTFTQDTPYVGDDFNDATSSIKISTADQVVTIYQDANYSGASQVLPVGRYDLQSLQIGNDQLSSLKIPLGMRVTLFADAGFTGNTKTFLANTPFVGADFNDVASSIEVVMLTVKTLSGPIVFDDGIAITSAYTIRMFRNGTVTFKIHAHDSTVLETYDYGVIIIVLTPDKTAYTFEHQGHVSNIFLGSAHDDNYLITTTNPAIAANWQQILQAQVQKPVTTHDSHLLGEGWQAEALQIAETVAQVVIKIVGSAGGSGSGSGGNSGDN